MGERLVPCEGCSRHVRCSEVACPFCGGTSITSPQPSREPFLRLAAAAAVATGVAASIGCASAGNSGGGSGSSIGPPYGAFPVDASLEPSGNGITCRSSAGCLPGQVCCGTIAMTTSCQAGPCPVAQPFGPLQLCGISAECLTTGDICGPPQPPMPPIAVMICNAPGDSGTANEGGVAEDGSSSDGDNGSDTGISDAPTGS